VTRPLAALLALLLAGPGRADPAPVPPPDHPPRVVEPGTVVLVRPLDDAGGPPVVLAVGEGGGVFLDQDAAAYAVERLHWEDARRRACLELLDARPPPKLVWLGAALLAGAAAGYLAARAAR